MAKVHKICEDKRLYGMDLFGNPIENTLEMSDHLHLVCCLLRFLEYVSCASIDAEHGEVIREMSDDANTGMSTAFEIAIREVERFGEMMGVCVPEGGTHDRDRGFQTRDS